VTSSQRNPIYDFTIPSRFLSSSCFCLFVKLELLLFAFEYFPRIQLQFFFGVAGGNLFRSVRICVRQRGTICKEPVSRHGCIVSGGHSRTRIFQRTEFSRITFTDSSNWSREGCFDLAVGSLKEEHKPLDFVIPDQFFDRTRHRVDTFFGGGVVAHIAFADPVCGDLARVVESACKQNRP